MSEPNPDTPDTTPETPETPESPAPVSNVDPDVLDELTDPVGSEGGEANIPPAEDLGDNGSEAEPL